MERSLVVLISLQTSTRFRQQYHDLLSWSAGASSGSGKGVTVDLEDLGISSGFTTCKTKQLTHLHEPWSLALYNGRGDDASVANPSRPKLRVTADAVVALTAKDSYREIVTNSSKHLWRYFWRVSPDTVPLASLTNGETGLRATEIVQLIKAGARILWGQPWAWTWTAHYRTYVELSVAPHNQQPPPWSRPVQTTCSTAGVEHGAFLLLVKEWGQGWLIWEMMIAETSSKLLSHTPTYLQEGHSWPQ